MVIKCTTAWFEEFFLNNFAGMKLDRKLARSYYSSKGITTSSKKLLVAGASLLVTSESLLVAEPWTDRSSWKTER